MLLRRKLTPDIRPHADSMWRINSAEGRLVVAGAQGRPGNKTSSLSFRSARGACLEQLHDYTQVSFFLPHALSSFHTLNNFISNTFTQFFT